MERFGARDAAAPWIDTRAVKALFDTNILIDHLNGIEARAQRSTAQTRATSASSRGWKFSSARKAPTRKM